MATLSDAIVEILKTSSPAGLRSLEICGQLKNIATETEVHKELGIMKKLGLVTWDSHKLGTELGNYNLPLDMVGVRLLEK